MVTIHFGSVLSYLAWQKTRGLPIRPYKYADNKGEVLFVNCLNFMGKYVS